jgi:hypothetical protein
VFVLCGEFSGLAPAIYSSAVLSRVWAMATLRRPHHRKTLGPFEGADGMFTLWRANRNSDCGNIVARFGRVRDLPSL